MAVSKQYLEDLVSHLAVVDQEKAERRQATLVAIVDEISDEIDRQAGWYGITRKEILEALLAE